MKQMENRTIARHRAFRRAARRARLPLAFAFALATFSSLGAAICEAQQRLWFNFDSGDSWMDPENWLPNDVPDTPGEWAVINNGSVVFDVRLQGAVTVDHVDLLDPDVALRLVNSASLTMVGPTGLTIADGAALTGIGSSSTTSTLAGVINNDGILTSISGNLDIVAPAIVNTGVINVQGSLRTLSISCPDLDNTGGVLRSSGGGTLRLESGTAVTGGVVSRTSTNALFHCFGGVAFENVAIEYPAFVDVKLGSLTISGDSLRNDGTIRLGAFGEDDTLLVESTLAADGAGEITLVRGPATLGSIVVAAPSTFTNGAEHTIAGSGDISGGFMNAGTLRADFGLLRVVDLPLNYSSADSTLTGGAWRARSGGVLELAGAAIARNNATIVVEGIGSRFTDGSTDALANLWSNMAAGDVSILDDTLSIALGGEEFVNRGRFHVGDLGVVSPSRNALVRSGQLIVDGAFGREETLTRVVGGELSGRGVVLGEVINSATVSPGGSIGELTIGRHYTQNPEATLRIELGDHTQGRWDTLTVAEDVSLDGTLAIETASGFLQSMADEYLIVRGGFVTGTFSQVLIDGVPDTVGLAHIAYTDSTVTVVVRGIEWTGVDDANPGSFATAGDGDDPTLRGRTIAGGGVFQLALPSPAHVRLDLFDVSGRQIGTLADRVFAEGSHAIRVDAATLGAPRLPSGVYFGRAEVTRAGASQARAARLVVVR